MCKTVFNVNFGAGLFAVAADCRVDLLKAKKKIIFRLLLKRKYIIFCFELGFLPVSIPKNDVTGFPGRGVLLY
jgi:hypothetical protein